MTSGKKRLAKNYLLVTVGCLVLALATSTFLVPYNIINGGVTSIAIIIQHFINLSGSSFQAIDIVTWAIEILFLVVSFIFLGRQYTIRTIFSTALYPLFFTLFYRIQIFDGKSLGLYIAFLMNQANNEPLLVMLLGALFGGVLQGLGVALSFAGGGTTGGLDVLAVLLAKVTPIKEATITFLVDGMLVIIGMIVMRNVTTGLLGIVSAFMCAFMIQFAYVNANSFVIADVITDKVEEITDYVVKHLDRTTTVFTAMGGYSKQERQVVRVCLAKNQLHDFKEEVSQIDPRAFVTFVTANMIHGEGFDPLVAPNAKELISKANETRRSKKDKK